ncbi:MAG: DNA mismatch repair endonuclease MutL [Acetobacteraceae bacterium]|nr:DNA mismatch repair endonuclease MutL [Acetobacteraceae bacterium]
MLKAGTGRAEPRVRVLDQATVSRIAAGEVVERPASVVKELWENAVDAGALRVQVLLEEGGKRLIQVQDDGCGMSAADARLALERHATSKIRDISDLGQLGTLGFRGEALPSIAAVSKLEILTGEEGGLFGTRLVVEGGRLVSVGEAGCTPGTTVWVRDLFFNTPARRAQLRMAAAELASCSEVLAQAALARPSVALSARHGSRLLLATPGRGDLRETVAAVYGAELARGLLEARMEAGALRLEVLVGPPALARAGRALQHFSVNGRPVRNPGLRRVLEECFRSLLPSGRHPVALLHIHLPPGGVDVNVHPSKAEVRFLDEEAVWDAVRRAVGSALARGALAVAPGFLGSSRPAAARPHAAEAPTAVEGGSVCAPGRGAATAASTAGPGLEVAEPAGPGWRPAAAGAAGTVLRDELAALEPLGQVGGTYLVAAGPDGLYLLDQHAAHERVYFEAFLSRPGERSAQPLLVPFTVELGPAEQAQVEARPEVLAAMGFEVEPFGGGALLIRAVPSSLADQAGPALVRDVVGRWLEGESEWRGDQARPQEEVAALVVSACRAAIKAHQSLSREEARALLRDLAACQMPHTCPHGRPILARLGLRELERLFGRA